jgi:hypothetical protein
MLHVSNVSLNTGKKAQSGTKYKVFISGSEGKFLIANLSEGGLENYALDLYFKSNETPTFSVESTGKSNVSVTGYWESAPDVMDDDDYGMDGMGGMDGMDMEALDEEEEADLDPVTRSNIGKHIY